MRKRYEAALALLPRLQLRPGVALREALAEGYGRRELGRDVLAGLVVGLVALPLAMALGINSGVAPQNGIYTAIVAGLIIAILGGSRVQVSGPTAAFVVILAPIAGTYGLAGLAVATVMAGVMLIVMGLARMGRLVQFIPYPVTTGFTSGIAVVIASLQLKDVLGLELKNPDHFVERIRTVAASAGQARWPDALVAGFTLAILLLWPRLSRRIPAPLVALSAAGLLAYGLAQVIDGFHVATIASRFSYTVDGVTHAGIPPLPPLPVIPWHQPGAGGEPLVLSWTMVRALVGPAFAIALLGAIESLLCAVVADGMASTRHDPDAELVAQGVGNVVAPFFGGIAATGAIARTATNVRAGARSPVAAVVHALFVLVGVLSLAPLLDHLPVAAMGALLLVVAWNMSEAKHFGHMLRVAPKSDVTVLLTCFVLTVVFDMTVSVTVGVVLAALLFMRRMADLTEARLVAPEHDSATGASHRSPLPRGVMHYQIAGPLFFGATQKAISAFEQVNGRAQVLILDMHAVPTMDMTGLVALESALQRLRKDKIAVVIAGVQVQPRQVLERGNLVATPGALQYAADLDEALAMASGMVRSSAERPVASAGDDKEHDAS
jgi:SulP family sulfate permease